MNRRPSIQTISIKDFKASHTCPAWQCYWNLAAAKAVDVRCYAGAERLEVHHLLPKSIGGRTHEKENLVMLKHSDHVFIHRLLAIVLLLTKFRDNCSCLKRRMQGLVVFQYSDDEIQEATSMLEANGISEKKVRSVIACNRTVDAWNRLYAKDE